MEDMTSKGMNTDTFVFWHSVPASLSVPFLLVLAALLDCDASMTTYSTGELSTFSLNNNGAFCLCFMRYCDDLNIPEEIWMPTPE